MRYLAVLPLLLSMCTPGAPTDNHSGGQSDPKPEARPAATSPVAATRIDLANALEVLHGWDTDRARAWAQADLMALRALYVRGSGAGRADVRLLRAYRARGLVVRRLETQVFAVRVLRTTDASLRLRVFDRVAGGVVLDNGQVTPLRSSRPVTRTITFRLDSGSWRVSEISGSGRGPRAGSPRHPDR